MSVCLSLGLCVKISSTLGKEPVPYGGGAYILEVLRDVFWVSCGHVQGWPISIFSLARTLAEMQWVTCLIYKRHGIGRPVCDQCVSQCDVK